MSATSSDTLYTQASSLLSNPTRILGSLILGRPESISDRTPGPILAPHPPALVISVRRIFSPCTGAAVPHDETASFGGSIWQASLAFASLILSSFTLLLICQYYHNMQVSQSFFLKHFTDSFARFFSANSSSCSLSYVRLFDSFFRFISKNTK